MNPEIKKLQTLIQDHKISFDYLDADYLDLKEYYKAVLFEIGGRVYKIYVDHEYKDIDRKIPELSLFLVLRELELVAETDTFEIWAAEQMIELNDQIRNYYLDLKSISKEIEKQLGSLDPILSQMEYELNAGSVQELRNR